MTLARFVIKNALRNKRRSILTMLSIAFSLLLLTFMMTLWRAFALDGGSTESAKRLVVREWSRWCRSPGLRGFIKDQKPGNFFARFGTDPNEFRKVYRDMQIPDEQVKA